MDTIAQAATAGSVTSWDWEGLQKGGRTRTVERRPSRANFGHRTSALPLTVVNSTCCWVRVPGLQLGQKMRERGKLAWMIPRWLLLVGACKAWGLWGGPPPSTKTPAYLPACPSTFSRSGCGCLKRSAPALALAWCLATQEGIYQLPLRTPTNRDSPEVAQGWGWKLSALQVSGPAL